jgi:hypothetical protein
MDVGNGGHDSMKAYREPGKSAADEVGPRSWGLSRKIRRAGTEQGTSHTHRLAWESDGGMTEICGFGLG